MVGQRDRRAPPLPDELLGCDGRRIRWPETLQPFKQLPKTMPAGSPGAQHERHPNAFQRRRETRSILNDQSKNSRHLFGCTLPGHQQGILPVVGSISTTPTLKLASTPFNQTGRSLDSSTFPTKQLNNRIIRDAILERSPNAYLPVDLHEEVCLLQVSHPL